MYKFIKDGKVKLQESLKHKDELLKLGYELEKKDSDKKKGKK